MNRLYVIPVVAVSAVIVVLAMSYGASFDAIVTTNSDDPNIPVDTNLEPIIPADPDDLNKLVNANNQFAVDFYSVASSNEPGTNIFFSPWSIFTAFAIAFEGADDKAYDEMQSTFGFIKDDAQRRTAFRSINDNLNQPDAEYKLAVANALWIQQGVPIHAQYVDIAETYYDSTVDTVDLASSEGIARINKWVDENTNGKIKKIISTPMHNAILAITNAIYFKGTWATQFEEKHTRDRIFHLDSTNSVKTPMMSLVKSFNYASTESVQILELPYKGDKISMLVLLPNDIDGITLLENPLTLDMLDAWIGQLHRTKVFVTIPKFTLKTDYNLVPLLESLGLKQPFLSAFNFPKIYDQQPTQITGALHKAFVDVNEEGTEAAAVTGIVISDESAKPKPPEFIADRPFIFLIQDITTGNILFIGKMVDPSK